MYKHKKNDKLFLRECSKDYKEKWLLSCYNIKLGMNLSVRKSAQNKPFKKIQFVETFGKLGKKTTYNFNFYDFVDCNTKEIEKINNKQTFILTKN